MLKMSRFFYVSFILAVFAAGCHGNVFMSVKNYNGHPVFIVTKTLNVNYIQAFYVWNNSNEEYIWALHAVGNRNNNAITYGKVPEYMHQTYPESNQSPRLLQKGDIIAIEVEYNYDYFFTAVVRGHKVYLFQVLENGNLKRIHDEQVNYPKLYR